MSGPEDGARTGMGHLTCFTGTDNIPAAYRASKLYKVDKLTSPGVAATEHSVMCLNGEENELA